MTIITNNQIKDQNFDFNLLVTEDIDASLFSKLKKSRGWTDDFIASINTPPNQALKDIDKLVDMLHEIRTSGQDIVVLPDFDMDGVTSGTLAYAGLAELGFPVSLYVPDFRRGHDIGVDAIDELMSQYPTAKAIITTDSGVNSHKGIARAKQYGLKVLITDHHVQLDNLSPADVIVDPSRLDEDYPNPGICGAVVMWYVLDAYAKKYSPHQRRDIELLRLFAGIGTVSDVMPLLYENRDLVKDSLAIAKLLYISLPPNDMASNYDIEESVLMQLLRSAPHSGPYLNAFQGFANVLKAFRNHGNLEPRLDDDGNPLIDDHTGEEIYERKLGKLKSIDDLNEEFYAYYLSPAFNAIRRIDGDMIHAFAVFTKEDPKISYEHATQVIDYNTLRKEKTQEYVEELETLDQPLAPYVWFTSAPVGMLGLIASKLADELQHPVLVVTSPDDKNSSIGGSSRSPMWFNMIEVMTPLGFHAIGHEQACGVRVNNYDHLIEFSKKLQGESTRIYNDLVSSGELSDLDTADLTLTDGCDYPNADGTINDPMDVLDMAMAIESMRPFGHQFPTPSFDLVVDLSQSAIKTLGSDQTHLRITTRSGIKLLWWGAADLLFDLQDRAESSNPKNQMIKLRSQVSINKFMGLLSPQFTVSGHADIE